MQIEIKPQIDNLLELGFEFTKTSDYRYGNKYVLAMDTNTFIEEIFKQYGIEYHCNDESMIEIELEQEEIEYIKRLQGVEE